MKRIMTLLLLIAPMTAHAQVDSVLRVNHQPSSSLPILNNAPSECKPGQIRMIVDEMEDDAPAHTDVFCETKGDHTIDNVKMGFTKKGIPQTYGWMATFVPGPTGWGDEKLTVVGSYSWPDHIGDRRLSPYANLKTPDDNMVTEAVYSVLKPLPGKTDTVYPVNGKYLSLRIKMEIAQ